MDLLQLLISRLPVCARQANNNVDSATSAMYRDRSDSLLQLACMYFIITLCTVSPPSTKHILLHAHHSPCYEFP